MQRNGRKYDKKIEWEKRQDLFSQLFWQMFFDMNFPQKVFNGVFELPLMRNAQERHKKLKN
jgi:hypothetical protein